MVEGLLMSETQRLEALWGGEFGDAYIERNRAAVTYRRPFWEAQLAAHPVRSVLEVGCNTGANLKWLVGGDRTVCGIDVNEQALAELSAVLPEAAAVRARARRLPFRDGSFDMVFTMGVLIHQPIEALEEVMAEIERCSNRYVLCAEYFAETVTEVPYRGINGALFKRDFGKLYLDMFPGLKQVDRGHLTKADGWDDVTYWVFEK
jgi:pseudaminic acid biosynthesis-associated methylase